mmetsp:Transcript_796/g.595  ORF Transcript_796/g.595 Transcript_796/m.595 type:complete len:204 (-) Transcript_796:1375-1986(-)
MEYYPPSINRLIRNLTKLPGVGLKSAERFAMHILKAPLKHVTDLAESILDVRQKVRLCEKCFSLSDKEICRICSDPSRDKTILCVVEQPADMVVLEKSGSFKGLYHILSGALSPMNGVCPDDIRIKELIYRLKDRTIKEVVLVTSTGTEGEATASFITKKIKEKTKDMNVLISRIASGVPVGSDIKYVDKTTIKRAMDTRHAV